MQRQHPAALVAQAVQQPAECLALAFPAEQLPSWQDNP
jgi:hypothetical protein